MNFVESEIWRRKESWKISESIIAKLEGMDPVLAKEQLLAIIKMFDYEVFSLSEKEVIIVKKEQSKMNEFMITIKWKVIKHKCPKCWSYNTIRVGNKYEEVIVSHLFISNYTILKLKVLKRRFKCIDCEKRWWANTFIERFSFITEWCEYTETFKEYIIKEWWQSSLAELARKFRVSTYLVYNITKEINIEEYENKKIEYLNTLDEIYLWIDELSFRWRDYIVQITELKTRKVVWVLKNNTKEELEKWLKKLPKEVISKIKRIATDMNNTYKSTIQEYIKREIWMVDNISVADHYHIIQMFMKLIMEVYTMNNWMIKAWHYWWWIKDICVKENVVFNKYREDKLEWIEEYKTDYEWYKAITLWFYLSKRYVSLLLLNQEKLTEKQKHRVNQILTEFDPCWYMKQAYEWKEMIMKGIKEKDEGMLGKLIEKFKKSVHYKIETVWRTIKKWEQEIRNLLKTWITNAFTEWKNTKAKLYKRMAYWYKIKANYMKRLLLCL